MEKKKTNLKRIFNIIIVSVFLMAFFFEIIPIPVENTEGIKNPDKFIYGGIYWTSIISQIEVNNLFGVSCFSLIFFTLFVTNNKCFKLKKS